jgi:hypothetical protein
LKYMAVSAQTFPVPESATLVLSADVKASAAGTRPDLVQRGVSGPSDPGWIRPTRSRHQGTAHGCCKYSKPRLW